MTQAGAVGNIPEMFLSVFENGLQGLQRNQRLFAFLDRLVDERGEPLQDLLTNDRAREDFL